jgi:hypothetical protein
MQGPFYPFIDFGTGGSIDGVIAAIGAILQRTDANTVFICGHAPVVGHREVEAFRDMLVTVRSRIAEAIAAGRSEKQVVTSRPTKDFDDGYVGGSVEPDVFVRRTYFDLKRGAGRR